MVLCINVIFTIYLLMFILIQYTIYIMQYALYNIQYTICNIHVLFINGSNGFSQSTHYGRGHCSIAKDGLMMPHGWRCVSTYPTNSGTNHVVEMETPCETV